MKTNWGWALLWMPIFTMAQANVLGDYNSQKNKPADTLFINPQLLYPIFEQWATLQDSISQKSNILHLGDSHIQADVFTGKLRMLFQEKFGNAGRGFVFPYTLAHSYGNPDIFFLSNVSWESQSITSLSKESAFGLSGLSLLAQDTTAFLRLEIKQPASFFHTLKMAVPSEDFAFCVAEGLTASEETMPSKICAPLYQGKKTYEFIYDQVQSSFLMQASRTQMAINGFVLERNNSGILYHNIGVNGAKVSDFLEDSLFFEQLQILQSDLIIVSLGTNESFEAIEIHEFCFYITAFLNKLRSHNPKAVLLVTTPPPSRSKKKFPNTFAAAYARELNLLLASQNIVVFDMFQMVSRGIEKGTFDEKLGFSADDVHYTKRGYEIKAHWFFEHIIDLYEHYLKVKLIDANKH